MKRGFKSQAEDRAVAIRRELGLHPCARLPSERLAEKLGVQFVAPAGIPGMTPDMLAQLLQIGASEWSAVAIRFEKSTLVIENTSHSPKRRESTRFHEMSHLLCGHTPSAFVEVPGMGVLTRSYQQDHEDEADWLGRCLQLPKPVLGFCLNRDWPVEQISKEFLASEDLVNYRLNKSGALLIRRRLAQKTETR